MIKVGLHKDRKHWEKGENAVKTTFSPFSYNVFKSPVLLGGLGGGALKFDIMWQRVERIGKLLDRQKMGASCIHLYFFYQPSPTTWVIV